MKKIHLLTVEHPPNGRGTAGTFSGVGSTGDNHYLHYPCTLIMWIGTESRCYCCFSRATPVNTRLLAHTSSRSHTKVDLAWHNLGPFWPILSSSIFQDCLSMILTRTSLAQAFSSPSCPAKDPVYKALQDHLTHACSSHPHQGCPSVEYPRNPRCVSTPASVIP